MDLRKSKFIFLVYLFIIPFTSYAGELPLNHIGATYTNVRKILYVILISPAHDVFQFANDIMR